MITYNHASYITEAIEGVLKQECNFEVELILANDCSPDSTDSIIKKILSNDPRSSSIKYIIRKINLGMMPNFIDALKQCKGEYIAICEGDDFWTDPYKLQKQVDFLETNRDYGMVFTDIDIIDTNGCEIGQFKAITKNRSKYRSGYILFDLLQRNFINTATVCLRSDIMMPLVQEIIDKRKFFVYDMWFWLRIAIITNIKYIDLKTAAYRVHEGGISRKAKGTSYGVGKVPYILYDVISTIKLKNVTTTEHRNILANHLMGIMRRPDSSMGIRFKSFLLLFKFPPSISFLLKKINK